MKLAWASWIRCVDTLEHHSAYRGALPASLGPVGRPLLASLTQAGQAIKTRFARSGMTTACIPRATRSAAHTALFTLLQEYEKRLLAKDHEVKAAQMQIEHLRSEVLEAKRVMAEGSNLLPAPEPTAGEDSAA